MAVYVSEFGKTWEVKSVPGKHDAHTKLSEGYLKNKRVSTFMWKERKKNHEQEKTR